MLFKRQTDLVPPGVDALPLGSWLLAQPRHCWRQRESFILAIKRFRGHLQIDQHLCLVLMLACVSEKPNSVGIQLGLYTYTLNGSDALERLRLGYAPCQGVCKRMSLQLCCILTVCSVHYRSSVSRTDPESRSLTS